MKKIVFALSIILLILSCEVEGDLTRDIELSSPITENTPPIATGNFMPTSGIKVSGSAKIYLNGNQNEVRLENFSISSGPDLKVYLSKNATPTNFVNLGNLTSSTVYSIPTQVNVSSYKYVLIHCQQYSHLFAVAQLSQN
ncbi:electron transfer DM13 [Flavobacterium limicola]|uniref:Electron transfer DM13 n=1 Tax=Flavobacterium limicola TaxID=180441 RepID=A0A495S4J4_9FLAO|nr:DM13 domain-containing protein [Flavobacterium limicola]RKS94038.1 electron transfer DM13 [Flavobacterium limicola]